MTDTSQDQSDDPRRRGGFTKEMRAERAAALAGNAGHEQRAGAQESYQDAGPSEANSAQVLPMDDGPTADALPRLTRETRKPFGSMVQKLAYPARRGFHRHWFNDKPGRIDYATQQAGYTHVRDAQGKNVVRVVGVGEGGLPVSAYLLEIPQEWFDDDMRIVQDKISEDEERAARGNVEGKNAADKQRFYPSAQGRNISVSRGPLR